MGKGNGNLVLTRRAGEDILIGRGIKVHVISVSSGQVRLGFHCPPDVSVSRGEFGEASHAEFQRKREEGRKP